MRRAIVLCGGAGTRLRPFTTTIPKPLAPVGEKPILEILLRRLARAGFGRATLCVSRAAELLRAFFGDGARLGIALDYAVEERPLGTVGPLTLLPDLPEHVLVVMGDILTDADPASLLDRHIARGNDATVAACTRRVPVDFGVLRADAGRLLEFTEKPVLEVDVSMGLYGLARRLVERLPRGEPYGFDRLMIDGIARGDRIEVVRHEGFWLDIGRPEDFDRANELYPSMKARLDPDA
jgi:NDP-sugar pyrophosphorylase family protein